MRKYLITLLFLAVLIPLGMMEVQHPPGITVPTNILDRGDSIQTIPFLAIPDSIAAYTVNQLIAASDASAATENTYTTAIYISGYFNLSISGTWAGTVTVQRSWDLGTSWVDVSTYTANTQKVGFEPEENIQYRVGIKTGGYTSGTAVMRLSQRRVPVY